MAENTYTSDASWDVPSYVSTVTLELDGAHGDDGHAEDNIEETYKTQESSQGGNGGKVTGDLDVSSIGTLLFRFPSGGTTTRESLTSSDGGSVVAEGGPGGRGVVVYADAIDPANIVAVAGGGGGGAGAAVYHDDYSEDAKVSAGGDDGQDGGDTTSAGQATASSGGIAGSQSGTDGASGASDASGGTFAVAVASAGGGGGGLAGGGGGGADAVAQDTNSGAGATAAGGGGGTTDDSSLSNATSTQGGSDVAGGQATLQYDDSPAAPTDASQSVDGDDSISVDATESTDGGDYDSFQIEVSEDGGTWADVASPSSMPYQYTAAVGTNTHRFRVRGENSDGVSGWTYTETVSTDPSGLQVTGTTDTDASLDWTGARDATEYEVLFATSSGSTESDYQTAGTTTNTSFTHTVPESDTVYYYRVQAVYSGTDSQLSSEVTAQVGAVDPFPPDLDTSVEDEITATWEDVITSGEYRIQIRATGESSWDSNAEGYAEAVVSESTTSTTFTGREDGEEYEVRLRTETNSDTSNWTAPVSAIALFPGAIDATVSETTPTSATVAAQDNSDNESGFRYEREERIDGEWRDRQVVAEQDANAGTGAISATDDTVSPSTTYRYRVEAYTEHTTTTSDWTSSVTTPSLDGVATSRAGSSKWVLRVEHTNGSIHRPQTAGTPRFQPTLNDLPSARYPVPHDEKWHAEGFENANVELYKDGRRLPIGELVDVHDKADHMVLALKGGRDLLDRVTREVDEKDAHLEARDIIQSIGYAASVDDPAADTRNDVLMQEGDTQTELQTAVPSAPFPSSSPAHVRSDGVLDTHESAKFVEAEDADTSAPEPSSNENLSGGGGVSLFAAGQSISHTFTTRYDWTANNWEAGLLVYVPDDHGGSEPALEMRVDDTLVWEFTNTNWLGDTFIGKLSWHDFAADFDLPAGEHNLELNVTADADSGDNIWADALLMRDTQYGSSSPSAWTPTSGDVGPLEWPKAHPEHLEVETADADSIEQVVSGSLSSTWTATSGMQAVALSNDEGSTWHEATNTSSVTADFASGSAQIRARFTLSYADSGSGTLKYDDSSAVDAFEVRANLTDTPLLVNTSPDGSAVSVLNSIAEYGNFVWEVAWDAAIDGYRVHWTQPGQRTSTVDPSVVDYSTSKRMGDMRYGTAVVKGSNRPVSGERFTSSYGTSVALGQDNILRGSQAVYDPANGTQFEEDTDYSMDYSSGAITVLSSGSMSDATEYAIDYRYRTQESYTSPSADPTASELIRVFTPATSDRECGQIALNIVKEIQDPVWEVELTIDELEPGQLLVDEFAWPIPTDDQTVEIRNVTEEAGSVSVTGRGRSLSEVVSDIRGRLEDVSQRS